MVPRDDQRVEAGAAAPLESVGMPALEQKKAFVRNNPAYGYTSVGAGAAAASAGQDRLEIDSIRETDFPGLLQPLVGAAEESPAQQDQHHQHQHHQQVQEPGELVYLDHAGATLFGASQLREAMEPLLAGAVHGNPHSQGPVSSATGARIDSARHAVLQHFGASPREWDVIFTSGATAALKMVGEQFPWKRPRRRGIRGGRASRFVHARRSHNSVLGIREYAREGGAEVQCLDLNLGLEGVACGEDCRGCSSLWPDEKSQELGQQLAGGDQSYCNAGGDGHGGRGEHVADRRSGAKGIRPDVVSAPGSSYSEDGPGSAGENGSGDADADAGGSGSDDDPSNREGGADDEDVVHSLFAFPAECNATGLRVDLGVAARVKQGALSARPHRRCRRHRSEYGGDCSSSGPGGLDAVESACDGCGSGREDEERSKSRGQRRHSERWWVLLDAAKFVGTGSLQLSKVDADFVALSFYKIFGYPTGLGALIVRDRAARILRKRYFGGGTVAAALAGSPFRQLRAETERRLTDGTEHFLGILGLEAGFNALRRVGGMPAVAAHTSCLARYLHSQLSSLRHGTGEPVLRFFGGWEDLGSLSGSSSDSELGAAAAAPVAAVATAACVRGESSPAPHNAGGKALSGPGGGRGGGEEGAARRNTTSLFVGQGPMLTMVFLRPGGGDRYVGHAEVEKLASLENIQLRTGCFCNPGACQAALGLSDDDVKEHLERGHVCWDEHDLVDGRPTGLVRASLGWMSTWEDAAAFVAFVRKHLVVATPLQEGPGRSPQTRGPEGLSRSRSAGDEKVASHPPHDETRPEPPRCTLEAIYVYPIKSCAPQRAGFTRRRVVGGGGGNKDVVEGGGEVERASWPLGPSGLAFDREWAVVDHRDRALRLKQVPDMCRIRPFVDLAAGTLAVSAPGMPDLVLPLDYLGQEDGPNNWSEGKAHGLRSSYTEGDGTSGAGECCPVEDNNGGVGVGVGVGGDNPVTVRVCGNRRAGVTCAASASAWFTRFLGVRCSLVRAAVVAAAASEPSADGVPAVADGNGDGSSVSPCAPSSGGKDADLGGVSRIVPWLPAGLGAMWRPSSCPVPTTGVMSTAKDGGGGGSGSGGNAVGCRAFANEAPYLLISRASVAKANDMIRREGGIGGRAKEVSADGDAEIGENHEQVTTAHFRPNFVVNGIRAHEEDGWKNVRFGGGIPTFRVTGPCSRCTMINIDPDTGDASGIALKVLAGYRREWANILFGQFLALKPPLSSSAAGARITGAETFLAVGAGGGGVSGANGNGGGGEENLAARAPPAAEKGASAEGVSGVRGGGAGGQEKVSPGSSAGGVWRFWVSEGMEVVGEA
eukprot:g6757.t1